jgi:hypothetical protein
VPQISACSLKARILPYAHHHIQITWHTIQSWAGHAFTSNAQRHAFLNPHRDFYR